MWMFMVYATVLLLDEVVSLGGVYHSWVWQWCSDRLNKSFPPYLLGMLESKISKFPSKAESTSKFKRNRLANPSSEHEMSTVTWGTDEIGLTGRSKHLIRARVNTLHLRVQQNKELKPPYLLHFSLPTCALWRKRENWGLRAFFPFFSLTKGDSGSVQQGSSPSPRSIF